MEHITCRELADIILGDPKSEVLMMQQLRRDGITIVEDWAARPAVRFAEAKRYVSAYVKLRKQREADYNRERATLAEAHNAQMARDELIQSEWTLAMRATNGNRKKARTATIAAVREAEKDLPREVVRRLTWINMNDLVPGTL